MANGERYALVGAVVIAASALTYIVTSNNLGSQPSPQQFAALPEQSTSSSEEALRAAEDAERRRREEGERREAAAFAIAEDEHERVVRTAYECGRNIAYDVDDWEYVEPRDEYKIDLTMTWEGCVSGGFYEAKGTVRQEDGEISWHPDWHSERLETYVRRRNFTQVAVGAAVVIGTVVSQKRRVQND